jgi:hypothetical protein
MQADATKLAVFRLLYEFEFGLSCGHEIRCIPDLGIGSDAEFAVGITQGCAEQAMDVEKYLGGPFN